MTNDELLSELVGRTDTVLNSLRNFVDCYKYTQEKLTCCDVSLDIAYQKIYKNFYKLRLPRTDCYEYYFSLLERLKANSDINYEYVLLELQRNTGRVEASFASKLVATINPKLPVIDKIVLHCLGYRRPTTTQPEQFHKTVLLHNVMLNRLNEIQQDERFNVLKRKFTAAFPNYGFTDIKVLDLLIWEYGKSLLPKKKRKLKCST